MNPNRPEDLPQIAEDHYRIKPKIWEPRWYYLRKLRDLVLWAKEQYVLPLSQQKRIKLADYGCGTKPYISLFQDKNVQYVGIDLEWNPHADIFIKDGKIDLANESMEVVLSTQVLEHVENPAAYLKEAHRILEKNGLLLLTTHGYWIYHPDPSDFWRWTSAGLQKIVQENGFEVVAFRGILGRSAMGLQLFQDGMLFKLPKMIRWLWVLPLQMLIALFDKTASQTSRNADACTYLVVARKK